LPQLTQQHGNQLPPTGEAARMPLRLMLLYLCFKPVPWDQLQDLTEDAAYSFHGEVSSPGLVLAGTELKLPEASPFNSLR
jgi:hypothetical protein